MQELETDEGRINNSDRHRHFGGEKKEPAEYEDVADRETDGENLISGKTQPHRQKGGHRGQKSEIKPLSIRLQNHASVGVNCYE